MRFPLSLTRSMTGYLLRKKLAGEKLFPLVLMLEPLHACNLSCAGCGRIREYADTMHAAALDRPMPGRGGRVRGADRQRLRRRAADLSRKSRSSSRASSLRRKHVYLCTNGAAAGEEAPRAAGPAAGCSSTSTSTAWRPRTTGWSGARACSPRPSRGIVAAKTAGFQVCTNTTIYRDTDMHEIAVLFGYLRELGVDGLMISPAFGYEAVCAVRSAGRPSGSS